MASMSSSTLGATAAETRARTLSALGDPIRLQILDMLTLGERCVGAAIRGWVPGDFFASVAGPATPWPRRWPWDSTRLFATFIGIVGTGILAVGFLFDMVL